jgi:hypothetical protein
MLKIALFSRSVYPRSGGSSFVTEELTKNFSSSELFVIGGRDLFFFRKIERNQDSPEFYYLPSQLSLKGRGERFFELLRLFLFPINLIQVYFILKKNKPDIIVSTFPDAYFCWLALINARLLKKPFFTYFHNTYRENRTWVKGAMATLFQKKFFESSLIIFTMSDGLRDFYQKNYPHIKKFQTLVHTTRMLPPNIRSTTPGNGEWNLAFTGNFNDSNIEATIRVVNSLKTMPGINMNFYTPVPKALLKLRGIDVDAIRYKGYLSYNEYKSALAENDIMVLTHGFIGGYSPIEYETIFPTRTIELFLTGKPILAHVPVNSFLAHFLQQYECAALATVPDENKIREVLLLILSDETYRNRLVDNVYIAAKNFYAPIVVDNWKQAILKTLSSCNQV